MLRRSVLRPLYSLLLCVLLIGAVLAKPCPAFACSCAMPEAPDVELEQATAVFTGRVIDIDAPGGPIISTADPVKVLFAVSQVWKGPAEPELVVTTARDSASCGYAFKPDVEYLVYASGTAEALQASGCSRTAPLDAAQADIDALSAATEPTVIAAAETATPGGTPEPAPATAVAAPSMASEGPIEILPAPIKAPPQPIDPAPAPRVSPRWLPFVIGVGALLVVALMVFDVRRKRT